MAKPKTSKIKKRERKKKKNKTQGRKATIMTPARLPSIP